MNTYIPMYNIEYICTVGCLVSRATNFSNSVKGSSWKLFSQIYIIGTLHENSGFTTQD